jgi:hypothetical protein
MTRRSDDDGRPGRRTEDETTTARLLWYQGVLRAAFARHRRLAVSPFLLLAAVGLASCGGDSTAPPRPAAIVLIGDNNRVGTVATQVTPGPQFEIHDADGKVLGGIAFTVTVTGGGTLTGTPPKTVSAAPTALGTWILGNAAGPNTIRVEASGLTALIVTVTANAAAPATATGGSGPQTASGSVGAVSVLQPSIKVVDAFNNPVSGLVVGVQITGGGSVQNSSPVTNASGGEWTLGTVSGVQTVRLSPGSGVAAVVYSTTVDAGPAAAVNAQGATNGGSAPINSLAPIAPTVKVVDAFGNGVSGVPVSVQVGAQSGSVSLPNPVTDANGVASAGLWTLGPLAGVQTVTMSALNLPPVVFSVTGADGFNIVVRFVGGLPAAAIQGAVSSATQRMSTTIVGDIPDQPVNVNLGGCVPGGGTLNEVVDDLVVYVFVQQIDGPGGALAGAGPCFPLRTAAPHFPVVSVMIIDAADATHPFLNGIVLHELFHAVGLGSLWQPVLSFPLNYLQNAQTSDPIFIGPAARTAYVAAGGTSPAGVPVEAIFPGGEGTQLSHWRETVFRTEIMTGFVDPVMPVSGFTVASLGDIGYTVSLQSADAYVVPPPGQLRAQGPAPVRLIEVPWEPRWMLDGFGQPVLMLPPARTARR